MLLGKKGKSVDVILDAVSTYAPDVLLTAGHSLTDEEDLHRLEMQLRSCTWPGLLFVEVKKYGGDLPEKLSDETVLSNHCLLAWTRESGWSVMGRQYFTTSAEVRSRSGARLAGFISNLSMRTIEFGGRRFGGLICGEINAHQGRKVVVAATPEIKEWIEELDVVVNPTHDLMGNAGTLIQKRKWISQGGRVYISASNWNTEKPIGKAGRLIKQKRNTRTLHSVYFDFV